MEPFTSVSRSASVTHIMSMDASDSSSWSSSKIESEGTASIATNGLRLSILGFAASTLCQCLGPQRNVVRIAYISDGQNRIDKSGKQIFEKVGVLHYSGRKPQEFHGVSPQPCAYVEEIE